MGAFVDDTDKIHQLLYDNLEVILDEFWGDWVESGDKALLTPQKKGNRWSSSFQVQLRDDHKNLRGEWNRYSQKIGGSPINLVAYGLTGNHKGNDVYRQAYDWARDKFGLERKRTETPEEKRRREEVLASRRAENERKQREHQQRAEARRERKALTAREVAAECLLVRETLAEAYLTRRTLPPVSEWPTDQRENLGFHPGLEYDPLRVYESGKVVQYGPVFPALVFFIRDPFGDIIALQRIFLSPDGSKIETSRPDLDSKVTFGSPAGGACRIGGEGPRIGLLEGPETALGTWFLHNCRFPMWSALSTSGMVNFQAPDFVERIDIFKDGDRAGFDNRGVLYAPPGTRAAKQAAANQNSVGIKTVIQEAALMGDNLNLWEIYRSYASA